MDVSGQIVPDLVVILLDMSRAFDSVNNQVLLSKLQYMLERRYRAYISSAVTIGLGFDGAETNCRIAHILGTLMISY